MATEEQILADPDLINVHALTDEERNTGVVVKEVGTWRWRDGPVRPVYALPGLGPSHEGFYIIPNALNTITQLEIAHSCLTSYVEAPHVTNMHQQNAQVAQIWQKARTSHPQDPSKSPLLNKLHWSAMGYHYDWTARKYYTHDYSNVPPLLQELGQSVANVCCTCKVPIQHIDTETCCNGMTLRAEAIIVNFYRKSSTMGGHQDDVEYTMDHPVVSVSLGTRCVFLKGGTTRDESPIAVLLQSGDVVAFGGASRLSYHGVAKIFSSTSFPITSQDWNHLLPSMSSCIDWKTEYQLVQRYLERHRININIRQVYGDDITPTFIETQHSSGKRQKTI